VPRSARPTAPRSTPAPAVVRDFRMAISASTEMSQNMRCLLCKQGKGGKVPQTTTWRLRTGCAFWRLRTGCALRRCALKRFLSRWPPRGARQSVCSCGPDLQPKTAEALRGAVRLFPAELLNQTAMPATPSRCTGAGRGRCGRGRGCGARRWAASRRAAGSGRCGGASRWAARSGRRGASRWAARSGRCRGASRWAARSGRCWGAGRSRG
jgi:hypothetical protein